MVMMYKKNLSVAFRNSFTKELKKSVKSTTHGHNPLTLFFSGMTLIRTLIIALTWFWCKVANY